MFADRASFYRYAAVLGLMTGVAFAVGYHSSAKIQVLADKGFDNVAPSLPVPHLIRATVCSFFAGFVLTVSFLMLVCPFAILAGNDEERYVIRRIKILCSVVFLGDAFLTLDVIRKAFFAG